MEKEHFEVILEDIKGKFDFLVEGFEGIKQRQDKLDSKFDKLDSKVDKLDVKVTVLDQRVDKLERSVGEIQQDVRAIKKDVGILHAVANQHENRIQDLESAQKDHLADHS